MMASFPPEIMAHIVDLADFATCKSLRVVNHTISHFATKRVFRTVYFAHHPDIFDNLRAISRSDHLRSFVCRIACLWMPADVVRHHDGTGCYTLGLYHEMFGDITREQRRFNRRLRKWQETVFVTNGDKALLQEVLSRFANLSMLSVTGTKLTDNDPHPGGFGAPTVHPLQRFQRDTGATFEAPGIWGALHPRQCVLQAIMFEVPAITCLHLELNRELFDDQFCGDRHPLFEHTGSEFLITCKDFGECFPGLAEVSLYARGWDSWTSETESRFRAVLRNISGLPRLEKLKLSCEWPKYYEEVPKTNITRVLKDVHFSTLRELTLVDYRTTPECLKELLEHLLSTKLEKLCLKGFYMEYDEDSDLGWHEHEVDNSAKDHPNRSIWELFAQLSAPLFVRKDFVFEASGLMGWTELKPRQGSKRSPRDLRTMIQIHNKEGHAKWERAIVEYITQSAHDSTILMPLWEDYHKKLRNGYEQRERYGW